MPGNVYLKQSTLVEPLFNQWYAWPALIPPASASMYIANSHRTIMESFISAPHVHVAAHKNPAMLGGPFINHSADKVGEVRQLLEMTLKKQAHMIEFAASIKSLSDLLATEATGYSLEAFYPKLPDALRGYVELVYDLDDRPSIRFLEGLLYKSRYYDPTSQSVVLSHVESDGRPFVFSTPRLKSDHGLYLNIPFNRPELDELFKMQTVPQPYGAIKEMLDISEADDAKFSTFFTEEKPVKSKTVSRDLDSIMVRYFGHACILVESRDVSVMCDPLVSHQCAEGSKRLTYTELPETIDYVLITHTHQDHVLFETLLRLRHRIKNLIVPRSLGGDRSDPSLKLILRNIGFENVRELEEMESIEIPGGRILGVPFLGEHADLNIRTKLAYLIDLNRRTILVAADSNNLEPKLYEHLHKEIGDLDLLFLGMECDGAPMSWLYGPLLTRPLVRKNDQSRRFNSSTYKGAIEIVNTLKPSEVYVYAMGLEPWCTYLTSVQYTPESRPIVESNKLIDECRRRGITAERLYLQKEILLAPG